MATFDGLTELSAHAASAQTLAQWDSSHPLILAAVIEAAFGVRIPARDYPALRSYASAREYLRRASVQ